MKLKDKGDIIIGNIETKEDYKIFNKDMRANAERFFFVEISFLKKRSHP
jgi:hypothetical protein